MIRYAASTDNTLSKSFTASSEAGPGGKEKKGSSMTNDEWKEFRVAVRNGESPEVKSADVLGLLIQRDELLDAAKAARDFLDADNPTLAQSDRLYRRLTLLIGVYQ
jgi:hypothetical protein